MPTKREDLPGTLKRSPRKARRLGVQERSKMTKEELARAIARKQD